MALFTIPFSKPFLTTLVDGIMDRFGHDPLTLGQTIVLLPTRRGCLNLKTAFQRHSQKTQILPKIIALADLEQVPALPGFIPDILPPEMPKAQQLGLLSQMVLAYGKKQIPLSTTKALQLAEGLLTLLDEIHTSDVDLANLKDLVGEEFAHHWQITLDFLQIITEFWPRILAERGFMDSSLRRRENLRMIAREWRPTTPVILAGTTATRPATGDLAHAIMGFDQGSVVLPGYEVPSESFDDNTILPPTHPQYTLQQFVKRLGFEPQNVGLWCENQQNTHHTQQLLQQVMAPVFDHIMPLSQNKIAMPAFTLIECQDVQEEALSIGILIRKILAESSEKPYRTIAVITPDQELTRRLQAALKRWHIVANSSAGTPLHQTVVGTYLSLIAGVHAKTTAITWLSLLKHPLFWKHRDRGEHLTNVRQFDRFLRQQRTPKSTVFPFDQAPLPENLKEWYAEILYALTPLTSLSGQKGLDIWLKALEQTAENLCAPEKLWIEADGLAAREFLQKMAPYAGDYPRGSAFQFSTLLPQLFSKDAVHEHEGIGSPVMILGALEARQYQGDITILAGLNEETWPKGLSTDPWLNHQMRLALGLPDPQRRIGLSAHDFCIGFSAAQIASNGDESPRLYLTRSVKKNGTSTIPSRWWLRLETILQANKIPLPLDTRLITLARQLDRPKDIVPLEPPCPRPIWHRRPLVYSVTDLEQLMRDPYGLYAKRILKLKKLDALDQELEAKDFGQLVHQALDLFHKKHGGSLDGEALLNCGRQVFHPIMKDAIVRQFWWPRFEQIAHWVHQNWQRSQGSQIQTELPGHMILSIDDHQVELRTIVDRVEIDVRDAVHIIDYKTGYPPTQKDVINGLVPQLPLEALILRYSMAEGTVVGSATSLQYWHLKGGLEGGDILSLKKVDDLIATTEEGVQCLLTHFLKGEPPYLSCPWGEKMAKNKDYHHLARVNEWNR